MFVLRKAEDEGERTEACAEILEIEGGDFSLAFAKVAAGNGNSAVHDLIGEPELAVELKCARLDSHGSGGLAGTVVLFNDAERNASPGEPIRKDQAGGTSADDKDFRLSHLGLLP